jgi:hypothetical protein
MLLVFGGVTSHDNYLFNRNAQINNGHGGFTENQTNITTIPSVPMANAIPDSHKTRMSRC